MADETLYNKGMTVRRQVLGDEYVDKATADADDFNRDFQRLVTQYCWGEVWTRSVLTNKQRSLNNLCMLEMLNPSIELGRSFVRAEYQRSFAPMMLLWSGIGRFIERSPKYAVLFGPVSISNSYSSASRRLIVEYFAAHTAETRLMNQVKPRRPFRDHWKRFASHPDATFPGTLDELSRMVAEIEPDHKGVPVLLRQYLRLGGRILAFNVDPEFGHALDGLIMVDLRQVEATLLAKYMGKSGTRAFRAHHSLDPDQSPHRARDGEAAFGNRSRQSESEP